jgi:hypothetical protein
MGKLGLKYDHSFMHDDFQPYYVSTGKEEMVTTDYSKHPDERMVPMKHAEKSDIVEIPANWTLDDWPPFQWDGARPNAVRCSIGVDMRRLIDTGDSMAMLTRIRWSAPGRICSLGAMSTTTHSSSPSASIRRCQVARIS